MEVRKIKDKQIWEEFLQEVKNKTFLQSWSWGEFQKMMGNKIWRMGLYENENLIGVALVVKIEAKRGRFLFVPHGPIIESRIKNQESRILESLLEKLRQISKEEGCIFIRIAPVCERDEKNKKIFKDLGFRQAPIHIHPELTWQMDLGLSDNELLMNMRKTTRYLIRQGLKNKKLKIEKSQNLKDVEIFNELYQKTVNRHHFVPFSLEYLKNEFLAFSRDSSLRAQNDSVIFLAKYKGEVLTAAIVLFWQKIGFYHQGASSQKYAKIPASYLLQWQVIKEAKSRGCKIYNFWGIADIESEQELEKHPWKGLSLFKKGFGGSKKAYLKTQDLPLSKKYYLTYIFEKLRKAKRRV